jgi:hypothetical protein
MFVGTWKACLMPSLRQALATLQRKSLLIYIANFSLD